MKCPICKGQLSKQKVPYSYKGVYFGLFDAYVCTKCNEDFIREKHLLDIENFAKRMGLWGIRIPPHKDISTINKNGSISIDFAQISNKYQPLPYFVSSIKLIKSV